MKNNYRINVETIAVCTFFVDYGNAVRVRISL
jgi:hypothetical protein